MKTLSKPGFWSASLLSQITQIACDGAFSRIPYSLWAIKEIYTEVKILRRRTVPASIIFTKASQTNMISALLPWCLQWITFSFSLHPFQWSPFPSYTNSNFFLSRHLTPLGISSSPFHLFSFQCLISWFTQQFLHPKALQPTYWCFLQNTEDLNEINWNHWCQTECLMFFMLLVMAVEKTAFHGTCCKFRHLNSTDTAVDPQVEMCQQWVRGQERGENASCIKLIVFGSAQHLCGQLLCHHLYLHSMLIPGVQLRLSELLGAPKSEFLLKALSIWHPALNDISS